MKLFFLTCLFSIGLIATEIIPVVGSTSIIHIPRSGIQPREIGVVVNVNDPQSMSVAQYYARKRRIPSANIIRLSFPVSDSMTPANFNPIKAKLDAATPSHIQGYAITWSRPWSVGAMSITSAIAHGYDPKYTNTSGGPCGSGFKISYSNSDTTRPYTDLGIRPSMMLAGENVKNVIALIEKGYASHATHPVGDGHFVRTNSAARSVRYPDFYNTALSWNGTLKMVYHDLSTLGHAFQFIADEKKVLFYLTGRSAVDNINSNYYVPGAVADHMTSYGGRLFNGVHMSILRWLEAGAIASYGTMTEPCAFTSKFPKASVLVKHYYYGNTVLEAYWKSVEKPGEGVFVGDPLARPFAAIAKAEPRQIVLKTAGLKLNTNYVVYGGNSLLGATAKITEFKTGSKITTNIITIPLSTKALVYKVTVK